MVTRALGRTARTFSRGLRRWGSRGCFAPQYLEHDRPTGGATAFDSFAAVLHRLFHGINDFLLGFALNAISFGHNWYPWADAPRARLQGASKLWGGSPGRQRENLLLRNALL